MQSPFSIYSRIKIFFSQNREKEVEHLRHLLSKLGATVNIEKVEQDQSNYKHFEKLYYRDSLPLIRSIVCNLADYVKDTVKVTPQCSKIYVVQDYDFVLWVIEKNKLFASAISKIYREERKIKKTQYVQCHICNVTIRKKRLSSHVQKVHRKNKTFHKKNRAKRNLILEKSDEYSLKDRETTASITSKILNNIGGSEHTVKRDLSEIYNKHPDYVDQKPTVKRCRHCNTGVMFGEDVCYAHIK